MSELVDTARSDVVNSLSEETAPTGGPSPLESVVRPPRFERGTFRSGVV